MTRHLGPGTGTTWLPATFVSQTVLSIAALACPKFPFVADPAKQAARMNNAAHDLLSSLQATTKPAAAKEWATDIAKACATFIAAFGAPAIRSATRLGLGADEIEGFREMLETARRVRSAAYRLELIAETEKLTATAARPPAEARWLAEMVKIYEDCFARPYGTSKTLIKTSSGNGIYSERGGPSGRFIAAAASQLASDVAIINPPAAWTTALEKLSKPKTVDRRLEIMGDRSDA